MEEIWKDVKGYEGLYKVSNYGSVKRVGSFIGVNTKYKDGYYLKPLDNGMGYFRIKLTRRNKSKRVMLHRIIAEAFIDNPLNKATVNHINSDKKDNRIVNLEWLTQKENVRHSVESGTFGALKINRDKNGKKN